MKINEILTNQEIDRCQKWGVLWCIDDIDVELARHYPKMELSDYLKIRTLQELQEIKSELIRFNEREEL